MNKFATSIILAIVAVAAVSCGPIEIEDELESQAYLSTSNEDEVAGLAKDGLTAFNDFCYQTRDYVLGDIKSQTNSLSSKVFSLFFSSVEDISTDAISVQNQATERLGRQLANPSTPVTGDDSDAAQRVIYEGQEAIQGQSTAPAFITAFKASVSAVSQKVGQEVSRRLNYLKSLASLDQVAKALSTGCEQLASYEQTLEAMLEEYKTESLTPEFQEKYQSLELKNIPCATSFKVIRTNGLCEFVRVAEKPIKKMLTRQ